ncbi:uncharacterized protein AAG666_003033 isoform 1-T1 [Megaptera novaeangliae]
MFPRADIDMSAGCVPSGASSSIHLRVCSSFYLPSSAQRPLHLHATQGRTMPLGTTISTGHHDTSSGSRVIRREMQATALPFCQAPTGRLEVHTLQMEGATGASCGNSSSHVNTLLVPLQTTCMSLKDRWTSWSMEQVMTDLEQKIHLHQKTKIPSLAEHIGFLTTNPFFKRENIFIIQPARSIQNV